jgi:hypothetical protein
MHCRAVLEIQSGLWRVDRVADRYDIGARLAEIADEVIVGALDRTVEVPSDYDLWLDARLENGRDQTWLADHSLYAASTFCRILGAAILRLSIVDLQCDLKNLRAAQMAGFDVARQGVDAIRAALDDLAANADGIQDQPKKAFGQLFDKLSNDYLTDEAFKPFRRILRDCILDFWPVAKGEILLGESVNERRLHTLRTAELETGVGAPVLRKFLEEAGAFERDDNRARNRKTFDAQRYAELLSEIPTLVSRVALEKAMGATLRELASLKRDGVLSPRTLVPEVKAPWRLSEGLELVAELQDLAANVDVDSKRWESILLASNRVKIGVDKIITALRSRELSVGQRQGVRGYHGLCVYGPEVDTWSDRTIARSTDQAEEIPGVMSAAAFGRSVGIRDKAHFLALANAGHTPTVRIVHPKTKQVQLRVTEEHMKAFHRRFLTTTTIEREFGLHRNAIVASLKAGKVLPFASNGQEFGALWLRDEAAGLFIERQSARLSPRNHE